MSEVPRSTELFAKLRNGLELCYQEFGNPTDPPILLIMGLGGPMGLWRESFCEQLSERGFRVIRYDNRDTGRSTKLWHHRVSTADVVRAYLGVRHSAPYGIDDFVDDAVGLLDHLQAAHAHLVGVSMGGMIAQQLAITHPDRAASLTSIMSTTGNRRVGWLAPTLMPLMLRPAGQTRDEYVEGIVESARMFGSPAFATPEADIRASAVETYDRGWIASGVSRHMLAVVTQRDRTAALRKLSIPAAVIHGGSDRMVHKSGGKATAQAIAKAEYLEIAGMGHDLPRALYPPVIDTIVRTAKRAADL